MSFKKKIFKYSLVQRFLAYIGYLYILIVCLTSRINIKNNMLAKKMWHEKKPFILAFWHNQLMMISFCWKSNSRINILASGHSDGRFGAIIGNYF